MERKLLLLGMLREQNLYGYQINELIETHLGSSINLTKPTAYRFLNQMEKEGWIEFQEEKSGKRPTRRVYSILPAGEKAFQEMLRDSLKTFSPVSSLGMIGIAFLDALPPADVYPLLEMRRTRVKETLSALTLDEAHQGNFKFVILHQIEHLKAELAWLDNIMEQFLD